MNFFEYQARARVRTRWLVALFLLAVALIISAVYGVLLLAWPLLCICVSDHQAPGVQPWQPALLAGTALVTLAIIAGGTLFKIVQLAPGGEAVARLLGATRIHSNTADAAEMAIASGLPVQALFVLQDERGMNALIAGHTPADAALVLTRGALARFSRDEVQAVAAHEISHALNGDMRLNLRLMGILHGIQMPALLGHGLLWPVLVQMNEDEDENKRASVSILLRSRLGLLAAVVGIGLLVVGSFGVWLANLIKAAISREREFLADAEAVQFTRNPAGLTGALKKIGARAMGGCLRVPEAVQTSHMFIASPTPDGWLWLFNTHPPLARRIRCFEPSFDGDFARVRAELQRSDPAWAPVLPPSYAPGVLAPAPRHRLGIGTLPDAARLVYAAALLQSIPALCREQAAAAPSPARLRSATAPAGASQPPGRSRAAAQGAPAGGLRPVRPGRRSRHARGSRDPASHRRRPGLPYSALCSGWHGPWPEIFRGPLTRLRRELMIVDSSRTCALESH